MFTTVEINKLSFKVKQFNFALNYFKESTVAEYPEVITLDESSTFSTS